MKKIKDTLVQKNLLIIVLLLVGAILYLNYKNTAATPPKASDMPLQQKEKPSEKDTAWETYTIEEIGLTLKAPKPYTVYYETQLNVDTKKPYALTLYVQNYKESITETDTPYQLYGIYQWDGEKVSQTALQDITTEFEQATVKETTVGGLQAVQGKTKGDRPRWMTVFLKDGYIFRLATSEATEENKQMTDSIVETFTFAP